MKRKIIIGIIGLLLLVSLVTALDYNESIDQEQYNSIDFNEYNYKFVRENKFITEDNLGIVFSHDYLFENGTLGNMTYLKIRMNQTIQVSAHKFLSCLQENNRRYCVSEVNNKLITKFKERKRMIIKSLESEKKIEIINSSFNVTDFDMGSEEDSFVDTY